MSYHTLRVLRRTLQIKLLLEIYSGPSSDILDILAAQGAAYLLGIKIFKISKL